MRDFAK
jgi:hypothetical protein